MMDKKAFYIDINKKHLSDVEKGEVKIDENLLHVENDKRLGISLQISISDFQDSYNRLCDDFRHTWPNQFYYPYSDLHITIFDFKKATVDYVRNYSREMQIVNMVSKVLKNSRKFLLVFEGISYSNEACIIRGYDKDELLIMRDNIRNEMMINSFENDERYKSKSAHITFLRFINRIPNPYSFLEKIEAYKDVHFGELKITSIDLVEHDWYNTKSKKRIIEQFKLS